MHALTPPTSDTEASARIKAVLGKLLAPALAEQTTASITLALGLADLLPAADRCRRMATAVGTVLADSDSGDQLLASDLRAALERAGDDVRDLVEDEAAATLAKRMAEAGAL